MNIAAIVNDLSPSQKSFYLIKTFNKFIDDVSISPSVFQSRSCNPVIQPLFSCRQTSSLSSYNGVIISTSLEDAELTLRTSNNTDKFLYVWDLSWLYNPIRFSQAMQTLRNDNLKIIARSDSHASVIKNFCNKPVVDILSDWQSDKLLNIVRTNK
jgi:hypothetical protein